MSGEIVKLQDICTTQYGFTASAEIEEVGPKFLRITDIVPATISWDSVPYCKIDDKLSEKYRLEQGDIVIARTGNTTGYAKLIREANPNAVFASYLVRVKLDRSVAHPGYVGRLVESNVYKNFVNQLKGGAAQGNANAKTLTLFEFVLPSLSEQEEIADILSTYDDLLENNRRRIELLERAARLLYEEWFVRLRFPGHEHIQTFDGVPEGWQRKRIDEVSDTVGGGTPKTDVPDYWDDGDITWFVPKDLTNNDCLVLLDSEKKITDTGLKRSSAKMLPPETILMTSRASLGYFGLYQGSACTNQGFISIVPNQSHAQMYLLHNLIYRKNEVEQRASGTTYKEINKSTFRSMDIVMPSEMLLNEFQQFAYDTLKQVRMIKKQNQKLRQARDLLLPRLMRGEVRL